MIASYLHNKYILILLLFFLSFSIRGQFAPAVGEEGSTAIYKDSAIIKAWATNCTVKRGFINIEDTTQVYTQGDITSNKAFFGTSQNATGYPENNMDVVSLGDGGSAIVSFLKPIANGTGPDFAVFENGFHSSEPPYHYYLELAFVEVSTDGKHFVRFPSVSLTQDTVQIGGFGQINPENIYNLAGKYQVDYGTPFDLEDISDSANINIDSINYVKIVDVIGDINSSFATYDSQGHIINDPWPSPFWTCGFDLNAVGVINQAETPGGIKPVNDNNNIKIWPIPANKNIKLQIFKGKKIESVVLMDMQGNIVYNKNFESLFVKIPVFSLPQGLYILKVVTHNRFFTKTILIKH